jgi:ATP-binding cassette subfamily F protein 3
VLGQFLFSADDVFKTVDVLSGGEKVRLSFAKLLLMHSNLLILDEPTNHLDIPGKEALEEALDDYEGTLLFVSHDRYFISRLANKLLVLGDGTAEFLEMTYQEYEEKNQEKETEIKTVKVEKKAAQPRKMSPDSLRREIARLETKITETEQLLEDKRALRFEPEYYHDFRKMNELDEEIDGIHNELAHLYERWEELSEESADA